MDDYESLSQSTAHTCEVALATSNGRFERPQIKAPGSAGGYLLQRIPVIWKRRRVGKAKRAHRGQALVGTAREERAFAHPTSDSSRLETAVVERFRSSNHMLVIPGRGL